MNDFEEVEKMLDRVEIPGWINLQEYGYPYLYLIPLESITCIQIRQTSKDWFIDLGSFEIWGLSEEETETQALRIARKLKEWVEKEKKNEFKKNK